ncbi:MAG: PQQ-binding-like beta-propeller repeat protein [Pirellulaceae bacterium]
MERRTIFFIQLMTICSLALHAHGQVSQRLAPPPRELMLQLQRGQRSVQAGNYSDAVRQLGGVLSPPADSDIEFKQDYFTPAQAGEARLSLKSEAERLIGRMPIEGRRLYQLRYGAEAKALLLQATKEFDTLGLADCSRRYFHTEAGHQATLLLGQLHLDQGRAAAAAFCFRRLTESPRAADYDPQASLLLSASWLYAGSRENARKTLLSVKTRHPNLTIKAGSREVPIFQNDGEALAWLKKLMASDGLGRREFVEQWLNAHGNSERNARSQATPPIVAREWKVPVAVNFPKDEKVVNERLRELQAAGMPPLPSPHALAVGDQIIMRTTRRVVGVDFATGLRIWEWPWDDEPDVDAENRMKIPTSENRSEWSNALAERMWSDLPYGQMSSNEKSVFAISNLGVIPQSANQVIFAIRSRNKLPTSNQLASLSLAREGSLEWIIGGENGADEPQLAKAFFLGPPLPDDDILYCLVEIRDEVRLVALDPESGGIRWQQQLAHVEGVGVNVMNSRRISGAAPSLSSGVLVCPTGAGVVVAIDTSSRSLLWGYEYESILKPVRRAQPFINNNSKSMQPEWIENAPIIHDGIIILAPPDSSWLYALDLLNGTPVWSPAKRDGHLFIGCVANNCIVLVGKDKITGRRLSDGEQIWQTKLPAMPSGRGICTGNLFLLPLTSAELVTFEIDTGDIVNSTTTEFMLGNLISFKEHIVSHGAKFLSAFQQVAHLRRVTAQRLRADPDDIRALGNQIKLYLTDKQHQKALETAIRAHQLAADSATINKLVTHSILAAYDEDFRNTFEMAADLADFMKTRPEYGEYLRRLAAGYATVGNYQKAFQSLLEFSNQAAIDRNLDGDITGAGEAMLTSNDRWIRQTSSELLSLAKKRNDVELIKDLSRQLSDAGQDLVTNQNWLGLARFLEQFSNFDSESHLQLLLAEHHVQENELLQGQLMLGRMSQTLSHEEQGRQRALLAQLLLKGKLFEQAATLFHELNEEWADVVVWGKLTGSELSESVANAASIRVAPSRQVWPIGKVSIDKGDDAALGGTSYYVPVAFAQRTQILSTGVAPFVRYYNNNINITNGSGRLVGRATIQRRPTTVFISSINRTPTTRAHSLGHLLILSLGDQVVAVNGLGGVNDGRKNVLWRKSTVSPQPGQRMSTGTKNVNHPWSGTRRQVLGPILNGQLIGRVGPVTPLGVCYTHHTNVVCVNPLTGKEQWVHQNVGLGCDLFGDEELLFVVRDRADEALVLRMLDGGAVGKKKVPDLNKRWATFGRNILAWDDRNVEVDGATRKMRTVWIYDGWSENEFWRASYSTESRGVVFDQDKVAIFEPEDSILQVVSLRDGRQIFQQHLPDPPAKVDHLNVRSVRGRLLIMLNETPKAERVVFEPPVRNNPTAQAANGKLYCIGMDGALLWPSPAILDRYYFVADQPIDSPLFVFHRKGRTTNKPAESIYSVLAIDLRDGRPLLEEHHENSNQTRPMVCQVVPDRNEVTLRFGRERRTFRFSDEPRPPEVPAITGKSAPVLDVVRQKAATGRPNPLDPKK